MSGLQYIQTQDSWNLRKIVGRFIHNDERDMEQMFRHYSGSGYKRLGWSEMLGRVDLG